MDKKNVMVNAPLSSGPTIDNNTATTPTNFDQVKNKSTADYFKQNAFSVDAFNKKYRAHDNETYVEAVKRVCDFVASVEKNADDRVYWSERWFDEIYNDWWHPAGSIMQGAGSEKKISLSNCTHNSLGALDDDTEWDNLESIIKNTTYSVAKCAAFRQGLGVDFSRLRPSGTKVLNSSKESMGSVHWMKFIDSLGYYVGQNGRIPAMLFSLSINHPDVERFISIKGDRTQIQNANISVQCTEAFYAHVKQDADWELKFTIPGCKKGDKIYVDVHSIDKNCLFDETTNKWYKLASHDRPEEVFSKTVKARGLMELIAKNMHVNAEPGIQNIDIARKYSNSDAMYDPNDPYNSKILGTNACCLVVDTQILTDQGWRAIGDIFVAMQSGETFLAMSYNIAEYKYELKEIVNSWQQRNDPTVTLTIVDDNKSYEIQKIECSADHPVLTENRGYVKAIELTEDDDITIYKSTEGKLVNIEINKEVKPLYDIEVKDNHNFVVNGGVVVKNSEQYLSRDSLCVLSSINCGKFSTDPLVYIHELEKIGRSITRFLDNVNECELEYQTYATPHQELAIRKLRRIGAGATNIAAWLFKQNLEYGTKPANDAFENFVKLYNYWMYVSTEELGEEKGNFGLFNSDKWKSALFVSKVIKESANIAKEFNTPVITGNHARNVTCSSIAPTGTLSLMFRDMVFSYGIEPAFFLYYWKRTRMGGKYEYYFNVPFVVRECFEKAGFRIPIASDTIKDDWDGKRGKVVAEFIEKHKKEVGIVFKDSTQITASDKLQFMAQVMKWIDSSISVTYMLPVGSTWEDVYAFIMEAHDKEIKSIAAFPDKKMYGIISEIPFKELAVSLQDQGTSIHHQNFSDDELAVLNISRENIMPGFATAPKRLVSLDADIYVVSVKNEKFCIVVGLQNNVPYEIFGGHLNGLGIKSTKKKGKLTKIKGGQYALEFDDLCIEDFSKQFTPTEQILFRLVSTTLRHGVPLNYITEQLLKATEDVTSMSAAAARCLKKYIKDGTQVTGQLCPTCKKELFYLEGCVSCLCGWSRC